MYPLPTNPQPFWRIFFLAWELFYGSFSCIYPLAFVGLLMIVGPFLLWPILVNHVQQAQIYGVERLWFVQLGIVILVIYFHLVLYKRLILFIRGDRVWLPSIFINALSCLWRAYVGLIIGFIVVCLGLVLFFPGIYLLISYSFFFPLLIMTKERSWRVLKLSFELVYGHWSRTACVLTPSALVLMGTGYMANFFVRVFWEFFKLPINSFALPLATLTWTCFISSLIFPLYFSIILVQMQDLLCRQVQDDEIDKA